MNVTKSEFKDRKLQNEGYLWRDAAEQEEHVEASVHSRITENNRIGTNFQTDNLLEKILSKDNLIPYQLPVIFPKAILDVVLKLG